MHDNGKQPAPASRKEPHSWQPKPFQCCFRDADLLDKRKPHDHNGDQMECRGARGQDRDELPLETKQRRDRLTGSRTEKSCIDAEWESLVDAEVRILVNNKMQRQCKLLTQIGAINNLKRQEA